jgi:hypothetical protein
MTCYTETVEALAGAADTGPDEGRWFSRVGPDISQGRCLYGRSAGRLFAVETGIAEAHTAPPISAERPGVKVRAS